MSPRALRLASAIGLAVLLLFAGRWTVSLFAERWWAAQISPQATQFVTNWMVLSAVLEVTGILVACAWFTGHLLLVYRAIGSVQVHRRLGNLEIREAVNLQALAYISIGGGLLLGFFAGRGIGDWIEPLTLGWSGFRAGELDPLLGRDLGFYITRLPVWRLLHGESLLLALMALGGAGALYAVIGALRWTEGRLAINDHARLHLGGLAALIGLVLAWGYALEPYEWLAGAHGSVHDGLFELRRVAALFLTGTALAATLISLWWAVRGSHTILLAIWLVLVGVSLLAHHVIPALASPHPETVLTLAVRKQLDQRAYGMTALRESTLTRQDVLPLPPRPPALLTAAIAAEATAGDSGRVAAIDRAVITLDHRPRASWVVVRERPRSGATVTVVLDDQTNVAGLPTVLRDVEVQAAMDDDGALRLPLRAIWPRGVESVIDTADGGVEIGSGLRRIALAWALQSRDMLGPVAPKARLFWHLDPVERVSRLAPFVTWGAPHPRLLGGELLWLLDGYLALPLFPGSSRLRWRGQSIGGLRAGFLAVVNARTGETRLFLRHGADQLSDIWREMSDGVIEPASAIPAEVLRTLSYPAELLEAQLRTLARPPWSIGRLIGRAEGFGVTGATDEVAWKADTTGIEAVVPFLAEGERLVVATVHAGMADGRESLRVLRIDSLLSLPDPGTMQTRWARFPTYQQVRDSVEKAGARVDPGPVRFWPASTGLAAYQPTYAAREGKEPALVWVSLALGDRRGAGHDLEEAWQNLLGLSAPLVEAGARGNQLLEARRLLGVAEAALRRGDLEGFGRAWESLRRTLNSP